MLLYGKKFSLSKEDINLEEVEYIPAEGAIVPLDINRMVAFKKQLENCGFLENGKEILKIYLFIEEGMRDIFLTIEYIDGEIRCVNSFQIDADELDFLQNKGEFPEKY